VTGVAAVTASDKAAADFGYRATTRAAAHTGTSAISFVFVVMVAVDARRLAARWTVGLGVAGITGG
jgi:hypothetical protein